MNTRDYFARVMYAIKGKIRFTYRTRISPNTIEFYLFWILVEFKRYKKRVEKETERRWAMKRSDVVMLGRAKRNYRTNTKTATKQRTTLDDLRLWEREKKRNIM